MDNSEWLTHAKTLPSGRSKRMRCCTQSTTMVISNGRSGYNCYCFRCGFSDFSGHGERSISSLREAAAQAAFQSQNKVALPDDFVPLRFGTDAAHLWFLGHGVSIDRAESYGIGYSAMMNRVILPVYQDLELVYLQARALDPWQKPKYLNQEAKANSAVFWSRCDHEPNAYAGTVVVTEDMLSTIKVGGVTRACSMLGTNMSPGKAWEITKQYTRVILWTDSDAAGKRGRKQAMDQLLMQGASEVRHIMTELDPKKLTHQQIEEEIIKCLT